MNSPILSSISPILSTCKIHSNLLETWKRKKLYKTFFSICSSFSESSIQMKGLIKLVMRKKVLKFKYIEGQPMQGLNMKMLLRRICYLKHFSLMMPTTSLSKCIELGNNSYKVLKSCKQLLSLEIFLSGSMRLIKQYILDFSLGSKLRSLHLGLYFHYGKDNQEPFRFFNKMVEMKNIEKFGIYLIPNMKKQHLDPDFDKSLASSLSDIREKIEKISSFEIKFARNFSPNDFQPLFANSQYKKNMEELKLSITGSRLSLHENEFFKGLSCYPIQNPNLKKLVIKSIDIDYAAASCISKFFENLQFFANLESLSLTFEQDYVLYLKMDAKTLENFGESLSKMKNLRNLDIVWVNFYIYLPDLGNFIEKMSEMKNLNSLKLWIRFQNEIVYTEPIYKSLGQLRNVKTLNTKFLGSKYTDLTFAENTINSMSQLESLTMSLTNIDFARLQLVGVNTKLHNLRVLDIDTWSGPGVPSDYASFIYENLGMLKHLEELRLVLGGFSPFNNFEDLYSNLSKLSELRKLSIVTSFRKKGKKEEYENGIKAMENLRFKLTKLIQFHFQILGL